MIAARNPITRDERAARSVRLGDGREIALADIRTPELGHELLDEIEGAMASIQAQLVAGISRPDDPGWRSRADFALKSKARARAALQRRVAELKRAEQPNRMPRDQRSDARRIAFINAAEELLDAELFTEIWARAAEVNPAAFIGREASHA